MNRVYSIELKKRTFEGITNEKANTNAVTSKYSPSKKYAIVFSVQFAHGGIADKIVEIYKTKLECEKRKESLEIYGY